MREKTARNGIGIMIRAVTLCLCLALLAGSACAEGVRLGTLNRKSLNYMSAMPDGRLLLTEEYRQRAAQAVHDGIAEYFLLAGCGTSTPAGV